MRHWIVFIGLFALLVSGCFSKSLSIVPVSGQVTLDGKPLPDCVVRFSLLAPPADMVNTASMGRTDSDGRFSLETVERSPRKGGPVGECVVVVLYNPIPPDGMASEIYSETEEYRIKSPNLPESAEGGTIRINVPKSGLNDVSIELLSP